jgi:PBP1b-binding outer membrane lipoprotein LpoB
MKHWISTVVVALVLSGCSQKAAFEEMVNGTCSSEEAQ